MEYLNDSLIGFYRKHCGKLWLMVVLTLIFKYQSGESLSDVLEYGVLGISVMIGLFVINRNKLEKIKRKEF